MSVDWVDYFITIGRDRAMTQAGIDNSNTARYQYNKLLSELAALRARITELEAATVLTPRQCAHGGRECFERGWRAMQDKAADVASANVIPGHSIQEPSMISVIKQILALTPPYCGDCNSLAPDAKP